MTLTVDPHGGPSRSTLTADQPSMSTPLMVDLQGRPPESRPLRPTSKVDFQVRPARCTRCGPLRWSRPLTSTLTVGPRGRLSRSTLEVGPHGRPLRSTLTVDLEVRPSRSTLKFDPHGRPARQTLTVDSHGRHPGLTVKVDSQGRPSRSTLKVSPHGRL